MKWNVRDLNRKALGISASRRTEIPGLFSKWFENRLQEGFAEYIPAGPPRRIRRSISPEDVTHFNFWSKWPRPFFHVLDQVLDIGYPVLWNITVTGLGGTEVEPNVPPTDKVVTSVQDLAKIVPTAAIQWRYDPIFLSERYHEAYHVATFERLIDRLAEHVDRIVVSFVENYGLRVNPDLRLYQLETGDRCEDSSLTGQTDLVNRLNEIAATFEKPLSVCCSRNLGLTTGCPASGCNSFDWACRVYPFLSDFPSLKRKATRTDCACSEEVDIGAYDTCTFGCRYSYGSRDEKRATVNFKKHDPAAACLIP